MNLIKRIILLKLLIILQSFTSINADSNKNLTGYTNKNCCRDDYLNFTGTLCVANDYSEYLPDIKCEKYVLLAESLDDEFEDGTACNVNYTTDNDITETLTLVCEEEPAHPYIIYLFPVSTIFLLLTIAVYLKTKSFKCGQDISVIIICTCLATVMVLRVIFLQNLDSELFYGLDEYVGKFALIAYNSDNYLSPCYTHLYGWTIPAIVIYLNCTQAFGDYSDDYLSREWYYKYLPISVLWCINLALFIILTTFIIARNLKGSIQIQSGCWQILRLILLASIWFTWLFEILSAKYPDVIPDFWYAMDIVNALHGVIVFIVMVICRKSIFSKLNGNSSNWSIFTNSSRSGSSDDQISNNRYFIHNLNSVIMTVGQNDLPKKC
uniref:CSON003460 protein n=1 Tax=Culicoides sonorensis TaxID=179676 RepID=A0A336L5Q9_CULSO